MESKEPLRCSKKPWLAREGQQPQILRPMQFSWRKIEVGETNGGLPCKTNDKGHNSKGGSNAMEKRKTFSPAQRDQRGDDNNVDKRKEKRQLDLDFSNIM
jgi:hypothetical protein